MPNPLARFVAVRKYSTWGMIGLIAQVAFMLGWVVAETWQGAKYSPIKYTISDMQAKTAPHVWFIILCFAIGSVGSFLFVVFGLRPSLSKAGKVGLYAPWILAFAVLAIGNSYPQIPCRLVDTGCTAHRQLVSAGGITDAVVSTAAFLALALTPKLLEKRMSLVPEWRRFMPLVKKAKILLPLLFILLVISSDTNFAQGLSERLLTTGCVVWLAALSVALIRIGAFQA